LEKTADKIRVASREDNLGSPGSVLHGNDIGSDAVAAIVFLRRDALALMHHALELADVNIDVAALEPSHGAADDVSGAILELVVDHLLLSLAKALHHRLLCRLCGDTPEIRGSDVHLEIRTNVDTRLQAAGGEDVDLIVGVGDTV